MFNLRFLLDFSVLLRGEKITSVSIYYLHAISKVFTEKKTFIKKIVSHNFILINEYSNDFMLINEKNLTQVDIK